MCACPSTLVYCRGIPVTDTSLPRHCHVTGTLMYYPGISGPPGRSVVAWVMLSEESGGGVLRAEMEREPSLQSIVEHPAFIAGVRQCFAEERKPRHTPQLPRTTLPGAHISRSSRTLLAQSARLPRNGPLPSRRGV